MTQLSVQKGQAGCGWVGPGGVRSRRAGDVQREGREGSTITGAWEELKGNQESLALRTEWESVSRNGVTDAIKCGRQTG